MLIQSLEPMLAWRSISRAMPTPVVFGDLVVGVFWVVGAEQGRDR